MDRYELLTFVHIGAAIVWIGGAAMIQFFALRTLATGDPLRLVAFTRDVEWVGKRVLTPAALIVAFFTPESVRIGKQIDAEGPESPAVQARIERVLTLIRLDLVLLFAIVLLMVTKPGV